MSSIEVEGARVHNLQNISLQIPHGQLTVICGVSGSGKSSLAFDTLFAEGQRRYVETFSPQARRFLDQLERPDVDRLDGIPPAVAVRQQSRINNPLSTVGSRTEILRYLQQLFAQLGTRHCPQCDAPVHSWSPDSVAEALLQPEAGGRAMITFPVGVEQDFPADTWTGLGFTRAITGGRTMRLEDLSPDIADHELLIFVDRVRLTEESRARIADSVRQALEQSPCCVVLSEAGPGTTMAVDDQDWVRSSWRSAGDCSSCGAPCPPLSPELLSFHSAVGACEVCQGTGRTDDRNICDGCQGTRLNATGRAVRVQHHTLPQLLQLECRSLQTWCESVVQQLSPGQRHALATIVNQLQQRLAYLSEVGLEYLTLDRPLTTLSGGEARRVMLTSVLGSGLVNTLYVLDEPTSGMHSRDVDRVLGIVRRLRDQGNTIVVVEHDLSVISQAEHLIELGPAAGRDGGRLVYSGTPQQLVNGDTATAAALLDHQQQDLHQETDQPVLLADSGRADSLRWLQLTNVRCHNVELRRVAFPLQTLSVITGVSGSGKSSLLVDSVYRAVARDLGDDSVEPVGTCEITDGTQWLRDVQLLEQNPLQRTARSIPVTWLGAFDEIRKLLADTHEARKRNYTPGTFSFNSAKGGRCERCRGYGYVMVDMQFLADVEAVCDNCQGHRFRRDVLEIRYRDRSVNEILEMTVEEAFVFFNGHHRIQRSLNGLRQIGLGYLTLGQPLSTLSGGEAQRLRIAAMLSATPSSTSRDKTPAAADPTDRGSLLILDEPATGLHTRDIDRLQQCLQQLVQVGHTVILIEHDPDLIRHCDFRIEMGPGPGTDGGKIVSSGWKPVS